MNALKIIVIALAAGFVSLVLSGGLYTLVPIDKDGGRFFKINRLTGTMEVCYPPIGLIGQQAHCRREKL